MKDLIDRLFLDWDKLGSQEEYEIMKQYTKKGRQYAVRYTCKHLSFDFSLNIARLKRVVRT